MLSTTSGQEYWSGLPCPPPEDLPDPGIEPRSPVLQVNSLLSQATRKAVKNPPANAGKARGVGSTSGSRRAPGEETAAHSSIPAWRIPRTEEPDRLQSMGPQRVGHD